MNDGGARVLRTRDAVAAAAVLTLLALVACGSALLGRTALLPEGSMDYDPLYSESIRLPPRVSDFTPMAVDLPRDLFFARQLHHGRLALWNPLSACGAPLWAEQGGPFFPLKLPFYLLPSPRTYGWFLTLRLIAAGLGAYFLARAHGMAQLPAITAGATFELSGAMLEMLPFGAASPLCVLPWVLLGAVMIARRCDGRAAAATALALGVAGLGGHPVLILLVYAAYAVALIGHGLAHWRTPRRAAAIAGWGVLAAGLGIGLAAPCLFPVAELSRISASYKFTPNGAQAWDYALSVSRGSLPLALFAPAVLASMREALATSHVSAAALGVCALVLAVAGLWRGLDAALLAVGVFGAVLATVPPGLGWIADLPGVRLILPYYAWTLVSLTLTQAVGAAIGALHQSRGRQAALIGLLVVLATAPSLVLVSDSRTMWGLVRFAAALRAALGTDAGIFRLAVPFLIAAAAVGSGFALRSGARARWWPTAFATLAVAEQLVLWLISPHFARSDVLSAGASPSVRFLQQRLAAGEGRFIGQPLMVGHGLTPMLYGLADARGDSALPVARYVSYVRAADPQAIYLVLQNLPAARSAFLDLAAVHYIAVPLLSDTPPTLAGDPETTLVFDGPPAAIYENRAALARARIARRVRRVTTAEEARDAMLEMAGRPGHAAEAGLADTVVLEPAADGRPAPPVSDSFGGEERARIVEQGDPDTLILEVQLDAPGMVVVADTYYPGWTATVDGAPTPIFPADLLFRAVYAGAGRHRITFHYAPRSFGLGCWVALATATACAVLMARHRDQRHFQPTPVGPALRG